MNPAAISMAAMIREISGLSFLPLKNPPNIMDRQNAIMEMVNVRDVSDRDQPNSFSSGTTKMDHA